jgi:hypothetical protein
VSLGPLVLLPTLDKLSITLFLIAVLDPAQADLVKLHYQIQIQRNLFYFKRLHFTNWPIRGKIEK